MSGSVILAFGYHNQNAPRHWNIKKDLEAEGKTVLECHTDKKGFFGKYMDLWKQFRAQKKKIDTVLVTFPGQYLVPLAWLLTRFPRKKLIFDAFISLHDSLVDDRRTVSKWNPYAWFLYAVDYISCHLADEVWIDTKTHRTFFIERFHLKPERIKTVYLKARTDIFFPKDTPKQGSAFEVLFFGTYIPLQGIEYIIDAAAQLKTHAHIHFTLIGSGQTYKAMRARAEKKGATNISFVDRVPFEELPDRIRSADLCLGIFGLSPKAQRVIPHKVYDAIACGIPVLTADSPAIREKYTDGKEVILCTAGDADDLAQKILSRAS